VHGARRPGQASEARCNPRCYTGTKFPEQPVRRIVESVEFLGLISGNTAGIAALSAINYRRPSKVFEDLVAQGGIGLRSLALRGASPLEGGIPIIVDGKVVGAIGVSGATSVQDGQVAKAGTEAAK
jgi:hypothetical protein